MEVESTRFENTTYFQRVRRGMASRSSSDVCLCVGRQHSRQSRFEGVGLRLRLFTASGSDGINVWRPSG